MAGKALNWSADNLIWNKYEIKLLKEKNLQQKKQNIDKSDWF